jgi:hypothetical protein
VGAILNATVRRRLVTAVTYGLLVLAFVLGVVWFFWPRNSRWEPAVNSLTLVAGLTGIFVERLTAQAERRTAILRAVSDELGENARLLADERFTGDIEIRRRVYPRLVISAVDLALVSDAVTGGRDAELFGLLSRWRFTVHELNRRLDLTELFTFTDAATPEELAGFQRALQSENSYLNSTRRLLAELIEVVDRAQPARSPSLRQAPDRSSP